jgi:uncharacterized damage-inducible protein DinB
MNPEAWLRGPLTDVPPLLMPVAHALQQVREDVRLAVEGLTPEQIWTRPAGAASTGFHVRHLAGALERLLTYARGEMLSRAQVDAVAREGEPGDPLLDAPALVRLVDAAVERALAQVRATPEATLLEARGVGRKQLPSTVIGLLFHAAEHSTRHAGQAITTARIVRATPAPRAP